MINQTLARRLWADESPLGRRIRPDLFQDQEWRVIVGVVADLKNESVAQAFRPEIYYPYMQQPTRGISLLVRTRGDALGLAGAVREAIWQSDRNLAIATPRTIQQLAEASFSATSFQSLLLGSFAGLALTLALIGIYSVLAYSVSARTREVGIRIALGAPARTIYSLVLQRGMGSVLWGMFAGVLVSLGLARLVAGLLFDVKPVDPIAYALSGTVLGLAALVACYIPARRAASVHPTVALRQE